MGAKVCLSVSGETDSAKRDQSESRKIPAIIQRMRGLTSVQSIVRTRVSHDRNAILHLKLRSNPAERARLSRSILIFFSREPGPLEQIVFTAMKAGMPCGLFVIIRPSFRCAG